MSHIFPEGTVFVLKGVVLKYFEIMRLPIETCVFLKDKNYKPWAHSPVRMVTVVLNQRVVIPDCYLAT